jgi:hypothetical protein
MLVGLASTVILGVMSLRDLWPRILFSRKHVCINVGPSHRRGEGSVILYRPYICYTVITEFCLCGNFLLALISTAILGSEPRGTHGHILLSHVRDFPNLEDQAPVSVSPRDRVAQLYSRTPSSISIAFYDSQRCGGGILSHLHMGLGPTDGYCLSKVSLKVHHTSSRESYGKLPYEVYVEWNFWYSYFGLSYCDGFAQSIKPWRQETP